MRLTDFIQVDSILCGFTAGSRDDTIGLLARTLATRGLIQNESDVANLLIKTEESHTTVIGNSVAIPHARVEGLTETLLMLAVSGTPVAFGPGDIDTCSVFFLLLSPPSHGGEHVRILARIARLASDPSAVEDLRSAGSEELLLEALRAMDDRP